jgi:hypothetical protein
LMAGYLVSKITLDRQFWGRWLIVDWFLVQHTCGI